MSFSNIFFAAICLLCSLPSGAIAIWAFKSKKPIHFWSGSTVNSEEITNISSYNRANGLMWLIYTACMVVISILSLFNILIGVILLIIICVPGTIALIITYNVFFKKYRSTSNTHEINNSTSKTPKAIIIATIAFVGIIFVLVGTMEYYGLKDPVVNILDNSIQIKAMYGVSIDFSEITNISLIEKSMDNIGVGRRTDGYGGFGETLKGNFESDINGKTLLFVRSKTSPTIKIERTDKKDVYISLRNSTNTEQLYHQLISAIPFKWVFDAFVDSLDMEQLGFKCAQTKGTGRKPENLADMCKLYIEKIEKIKGTVLFDW